MIELIKQDECRQRSNGQEEESKRGEIREQRGKHMNIKKTETNKLKLQHKMQKYKTMNLMK